ncbi:MAG: hypothetical protein DYG99_00440 [Bacteroidetes bacterium CHB5]|nr:hypothetical protein [Bacteroidetes bacterium CHB5]
MKTTENVNFFQLFNYPELPQFEIYNPVLSCFFEIFNPESGEKVFLILYFFHSQSHFRLREGCEQIKNEVLQRIRWEGAVT